MGFANSYIGVVGYIGAMIGSAALTYISVTLPYTDIFVGLGSFIILISFITYVGLKDVT